LATLKLVSNTLQIGLIFLLLAALYFGWTLIKPQTNTISSANSDSINVRTNSTNAEIVNTTPASIEPTNTKLSTSEPSSNESAESVNNTEVLVNSTTTDNTIDENAQVQRTSQSIVGTTSNPLRAVNVDSADSASSETVSVPNQSETSVLERSPFVPVDSTTITDSIQTPITQQNDSTALNETTSSNQNNNFSSEFPQNSEGTQNIGTGGSIFTPPPPPGS